MATKKTAQHSKKNAPQTESGFADRWQRNKSIVECLKYSLQRNHLSDVTFVVGSEQKCLSAHKLILSLRSSVFEKMLTGPMAEQEKIMLPDIEEDIFEQFLQ